MPIIEWSSGHPVYKPANALQPKEPFLRLIGLVHTGLEPVGQMALRPRIWRCAITVHAVPKNRGWTGNGNCREALIRRYSTDDSYICFDGSKAGAPRTGGTYDEDNHKSTH